MAYCLIDVSFVGEVESCKFNWKPDKSDYQGKYLEDICLSDPDLLNLSCEHTDNVEQVVVEVIVEDHLEH